MNELKPYTLPQFQSAKAAAAAAAKAAAKNKKRYEQTQKQARKQQKQLSTQGFVAPSAATPSPPSDYSFSGYSPRSSASSTSSLYEDDLRSVAATTTTNATTTAPSIRSSYSTYGYPSGVSGISQLSAMGISGPPPSSAAVALSSQPANSNVVGTSPNRAPKQESSQLLHHQHPALVLPQAPGGKSDRATQTDDRDLGSAPDPSPTSEPALTTATQHSPPGPSRHKIPHSLRSLEDSADTLARSSKSADMLPSLSSKSAETDFVLTDVRDEPKPKKHREHGHTLNQLAGGLPLHHLPHPRLHHRAYRPEYVDLTSAQAKEDDMESTDLDRSDTVSQKSTVNHMDRVNMDKVNMNTVNKDTVNKDTVNKDTVNDKSSVKDTANYRTLDPASSIHRTPEHKLDINTHASNHTDKNHTDKIHVHSLGVPDSPQPPQSPSPESTTVSPTNSVSPAYLSSLSSYNNDDDVEPVPETKEDEFFDAEEDVSAADAAGYFATRRPLHHNPDEPGVDPLSVEDVSSAGTGTDKTSIVEPEPEAFAVPQPASAASTVQSPPSIASPDLGPSESAGSAAHANTMNLAPPQAPFSSPLLKEQSPPMTRRQTAPVNAQAATLHPPHATHRPSHSFSRRRSVPVQAHANNHPDCIQLLDEHEQNEVNRLRDSIIAQREYKKKRREFVEDDKVLVGTKVSEGHDNYVTAYNMLTGLRVAVSRCNAKNDRPLTDEDFTARHKLAFDIVGNELTPSAKYDFKFKDYSPWVFRHLRELFKLDPADYLMSLTSKYIVSELGSPGKSGSFFYFSRDYRFIIKTIHHSEHKQLRKILKDYYNHVKANPNTLISQFYGLHRVKLPFGRKIHFIVMNNLFPPHRDIHRTFDLKGSSIGRELPVPLPTTEEEEAALAQGENLQNAAMVFKDINWIKAKQTINLGPTKREQFLKQLQVDVELLKRLNIMDYSLLIGIHDLKRGNTEGLRDNLLSVFQPVDSNNTSGKPDELRRVISATSPTAFNTQDMPYVVNEHSSLRFYADDGGFRSTNEDDEPLDEIYYLGIIDCLTPYGFVKRVETFWKSLKHPRFALSAIPSTEYGDRFFNFMKSVVKSPPAQEKPSRGRRLFNKLTKPIHQTSQGVSQGVQHITSPIFNQGNASTSSFQHHQNHQHLHQGHHFAGFSGYHTHSPQHSTATPVATASSTSSAAPPSAQRSSSIGSAAGVPRCNSLGAPGRTASFGRADSISSVTSTHTARSGNAGAANKPVNKPALNSMPPPASNKPLTRTSQDIDVNVLPSLKEVDTRAPSLKTELSRE
ncbi:Phosphatidylinositol 4-phosphate 5-kinase its3 [Yarrowia sp. B02]|nr:Phosphatidylinositol 4-phosphate 5-kinase its3 [Yarrowia sp. B02]